MIGLVLVAACGGPGGTVVHDREVGAACGTCVFGMEGMAGCFWAVDIDGTFYPAGGVTPPDDMVTGHAPDGMCSVERKAIVDGRITADGRFVATRFELLPFDGTGRKAHPHGGH